MKRSLRLLLAALLLSFVAIVPVGAAGGFAPEIARDGLRWFNVKQPLTMESLRGRVVILDFWTEGCINCIHIIPVLRAIEERFPEQVAVIGVHSPKFAREKSADSVQDAIQRYDIRHPIVHDPDMTIWRAYGVQAWPTLALIGADGRMIALAPGEPDPARFEGVIAMLVERASDAGTLVPAELALSVEPVASGRFLFPGKLKPMPASKTDERRWVLADAGHHQIVVLDDAGDDVRRYGSGERGFVDGDAGRARFDQPQGLAANADAIFVADTGNHAIRRIDLKTGNVTTIAGTGKRGYSLGAFAEAAKTVALASPWDLEIDGERIYFANAGTHQLGLLDLAADRVRRLAGSGDEALTTGAPDDAAFAQPSGLALERESRTLYVADAESSAIRAVALEDGATTTTLVGAGLFDWGRDNGRFESARLQHPLGVAADGTRVLVADTYNQRLRTLDLKRRVVADFDGGTFTCTDPVCYPLREPAGLVVASKDRVLVVDTGNHRIEEYLPAQKTYHTWAK